MYEKSKYRIEVYGLVFSGKDKKLKRTGGRKRMAFWGQSSVKVRVLQVEKHVVCEQHADYS